MVTRLRSIAVIQFAIVSAVFYALIGLLYGLLWWLVFAPIMMAAVAKSGMGGAAVGGGALAGFGALAVIFGLIGGGIVGFIAGLIYAALYNLAARWTGGIEWTQVPVATTTTTTALSNQ